MTTEKSRAPNEAEIRALIEDQVKSVRAKDVDGLLPNYTPDVL
jgi:ketosteroid isomerase-like protein